MRRLWKNGKVAKAAAIALAAMMMLGCVGCGAKSAGGTESATSMDTAPRASNTVSFGGGAMAELAAVEEMAGNAVAQERGMEENGKLTPEEAAAGENGAAEQGAANAEVRKNQSDRKLIKTVDMDVETKEFDKVLESVEEETDALGGYIENLETYNGSSYSGHRTTRHASLTIRIPKESLESFLTTVSDISNVTRHSENVEDVTLTYVDLESRKEALETEQKRLLALLEQAETVEDIITIESRLSEVRYQLESMESQLRTFDNKIDYSTVYLYIDEVEVFSPAQKESTWSRITNGFLNSIRDIAEGCREFGIWFLIKLPYLVCIAVLVVIAVWLVKKVGKHTKQTTENRKEQKTSKHLSADKIGTVKTEHTENKK